jgi:hypothetical protein
MICEEELKYWIYDVTSVAHVIKNTEKQKKKIRVRCSLEVSAPAWVRFPPDNSPSAHKKVIFTQLQFGRDIQ